MNIQDYIKVGARARAYELIAKIHSIVTEMKSNGFLPEANEVLFLKNDVHELLEALDTYNKA